MPTLSATAFLDRFATTFTPAPFLALARTARWLRRQGKIDAFEFLTSLVFGQMSALRLTLNAQVQGLSAPVARQSLHERFTAAAGTYFQAAFDHCLRVTLDWAPAQPMAAALRQHFAAVYLLDSTSFDVPATLAMAFPACGGAGSAANVKVLLRYELISGRLEPRRLLPGKCADQGLAQEVVQPLRKNELQISDKGFYSSAAWRLAAARAAFLLCPLPRSVSLWLTGADGVETPLDLAEALAQSPLATVEWGAVLLGQGPTRCGPVRVVAFRLSAASAARQRAGVREAARKQGRTPTAAALQRAGWLVLVTNAPAAQLPSAVLSYLYRLRWQIELIFRQCKWVLRLDVTESANPHRVQCEIWARLLAAVVIFLWHAHTGASCWQQHGGEMSFEKVSRLFQQWGQQLTRALRRGGAELSGVLCELWGHLLAGARKGRQKSRTNTWDQLVEVWLAAPAPILPQNAPRAIPANLSFPLPEALPQLSLS